MLEVLVLKFDAAFNDRLERGVVRVYLSDGSTHDFVDVTPSRFAALLGMLGRFNVKWNMLEKWLYTDEVLVDLIKSTD